MAVEAVGKSLAGLSASTAAVQETPESAGRVSTGPPEQAHRQEATGKAQTNRTANVPGQDGFDRKKLDDLMDKLNIVMNTLDIQARFSVHEATKEIMVKVVNVQSGKVIREIPPQRVLDMVAKMQDMVGLLMDERG